MAKTAAAPPTNGRARKRRAHNKGKPAALKRPKGAQAFPTPPTKPTEKLDHIGRPTLWRGDDTVATVLRVGQSGGSGAEIIAELGVSIQTFYNWQHDHPEFFEACQLAEVLARAWWEKAGRLATFGLPAIPSADRDQNGRPVMVPFAEFNAAAYAFTMRNRFRKQYGTKIEVTTPDGKPVALGADGAAAAPALAALEEALEGLNGSELKQLEGVVYRVLAPTDRAGGRGG